MEQGDVVKSETQFFVMPADNQHVQQVVQAAERELRLLLQQRAETMKRIGTIKQTLAGLARIFGESVLPPPSWPGDIPPTRAEFDVRFLFTNSTADFQTDAVCSCPSSGTVLERVRARRRRWTDGSDAGLWR